MFKKWFGRKSVPSNDGNGDSAKVDKLHFAKVFELELTNMEDSPVYPLTNQLSIGSEIGNIVIADPSVSPKHATFILQDEVVSVIDHGSIAGTQINGKKIDPGKYIILEETDVVNIGDLEIRLKVGSQVAEPQSIPDVPEEKPEPAPEPEKPKVTSFEYKSPKKVAKPPRPYKPDKSEFAKTKAKFLTPNSANALVRVFAVGCDLLLAYSLLVIFSPFDEFRQMMQEIPSSLSSLVSLLEIDWNFLWSMLKADYAFIAEMLEEGYKIATASDSYFALLVLFFFVRFISTLIFGMSPGEFGLGIRPYGNKVWARFGGALRVIIGMITWPFIIFDLPAIVSRKTFKDLITFTLLEVPSKFVAIVGFLFYIPLMIVIALASPLLQGLEPPEAIIVNDKVDMRVKVKPAANSAAPETPVDKVTQQSTFLNMSIAVDPSQLQVFPDFRFQGAKSKIKFSNALSFYQRELQTEITLEVFKTFDMRQLLGHGLRGNFFLFEKYPELYNFAFESQELSSAFKKNENSKKQTLFANEFITFTKTALSLDIETVIDLVQTETPYIKGFIDYRESLLSLLEYKDFNDIGFIKVGDVIFMKVSFIKQKPFDLIMPLMKGEGRIFKVTFSSKDNLPANASKFYKFNLNESSWMPEQLTNSETLSGFGVFDIFSGPLVKTLFQHPETVQSLYGYYFETSVAILNRNDGAEIAVWKDKVSNFQKLIETIPSSPPAEGTEDPKVKLLMNMRDLRDALENNNREYFGISATTTI